MVATVKKTARRLSIREESFAKLLVAGAVTQREAWKEAYNKPGTKDATADQMASRIASRPRVSQRIAELRGRAAGPALLTLNDRLNKLSAAMDFIPKTPADRQALARLTDVYTKIAGGAAPLQIELSGPGGAPIQTEVTVHRAPVRDRLAAMRAAREARG